MVSPSAGCLDPPWTHGRDARCPRRRERWSIVSDRWSCRIALEGLRGGGRGVGGGIGGAAAPSGLSAGRPGPPTPFFSTGASLTPSPHRLTYLTSGTAAVRCRRAAERRRHSRQLQLMSPPLLTPLRPLPHLSQSFPRCCHPSSATALERASRSGRRRRRRRDPPRTAETACRSTSGTRSPTGNSPRRVR